MKENLPSQIVEQIKADAEKKYPGYAVKQLPYKLGRQEQLVKDLEFACWAASHYVKIEKDDEGNEWIEKLLGRYYTTLELYIEYLKTIK